jgi:hypothetical protein
VKKKKKNTGRPYELLAQAIWQALNDQEGVTNVKVQCNVTLQGNLTSHEIDVYWEFERSGVTYRTVVQAKDWVNPVKQEQLIAFKKVLEDLPGQPRGIFVTRTGYQRGALQVAKATGIELFELRQVEGEKSLPNLKAMVGDWVVGRAEIRSFTVPDEKGGTREELVLGTHMTVFHPVRSNMTVEMDSKWFNEDPVGQQIDKSKISFAPRVLSEFVLHDSAGEQYSTLQQVVNDEVAIMKADKIDTKHIIHRFEKDTFFKPDSPEIPPVKINAIAFDILIEKTERPAHFTLKNFVKFVLRRIPDGTEHYFITPKPQSST